MFKEVLQSRFFTLAALVVIIFFVASFVRIEPSITQTYKSLNNIEQKIAEVKQSSSEAARLGDYIKSDAYFERQARIKLNYKKPDEHVVYVYQKMPDSSVVQNQNKNTETTKIFDNQFIRNLEFWWNYLLAR